MSSAPSTWFGGYGVTPHRAFLRTSSRRFRPLHLTYDRTLDATFEQVGMVTVGLVLDAASGEERLVDDVAVHVMVFDMRVCP